MYPVAALLLAWVIDRPVKCYVLAVTRDIRALPDMYALWQLGTHIRQSPHAGVTTIT